MAAASFSSRWASSGTEISSRETGRTAFTGCTGVSGGAASRTVKAGACCASRMLRMFSVSRER